MKKPSKTVEKYLKYLKLDSIIESYKTAIKVWEKQCKKMLKNNDFLFDSKMTVLNIHDIRNQFCITASGFIYDGNKIIADIRKTQTSLNNERKKIDQMTYEELRDDGIDRLYADDAIKYIKGYISKLNVMIYQINQKEFDLINDTLAYVTISTTPIEHTMVSSSIPQYKALIGMDPITRNVTVTWYLNGKDIMTIPSSSHKEDVKEDKEDKGSKKIMKMLEPAIAKINAIDTSLQNHIDDDSVQALIKTAKEQSVQIIRLSEAVKKLESSSEKVPYEKPVVGDSPEEVSGKKPFSVTSDN